jgi:hypothetical protein
MQRADSLPIPLQATWCRFLTVYENRTIWARVSKRAKQAADSPIAWSETVTIDVRLLMKYFYRTANLSCMYPYTAEDLQIVQTEMIKLGLYYTCKTLTLVSCNRDTADLLIKFIRPRVHLVLRHSNISAAAVPPDVATLTVEGHGWVHRSPLPQITTLHMCNSNLQQPNLNIFPSLRNLFVVHTDSHEWLRSSVTLNHLQSISVTRHLGKMPEWSKLQACMKEPMQSVAFTIVDVPDVVPDN